MNPFLPEHRQLLSNLLENKIDFILVGGYAVNFHGYNRTTGDLDLWIRPDNETFAKLLDLLQKLDFNESDIGELRSRDYSKPQAFHFWEEPFRVDVLSQISGVNFEDAYKDKKNGEFDGLQLPFINLKHLILSKITTGRPQDIADVEILNSLSLKSKNKGDQSPPL